ncbi:MAG: hypothetical protein RIF46_13680, partial [Cyclobacteriaceae bacterium]
MKFILVSVGAIVIVASVATLSRSERATEVPAWEDQFESSQVDLSKWTIITGDGCPNNCGFGNNELQFYTNRAENVRVENGQLNIEAFK